MRMEAKFVSGRRARASTRVLTGLRPARVPCPPQTAAAAPPRESAASEAIWTARARPPGPPNRKTDQNPPDIPIDPDAYLLHQVHPAKLATDISAAPLDLADVARRRPEGADRWIRPGGGGLGHPRRPALVTDPCDRSRSLRPAAHAPVRASATPARPGGGLAGGLPAAPRGHRVGSRDRPGRVVARPVRAGAARSRGVTRNLPSPPPNRAAPGLSDPPDGGRRLPARTGWRVRPRAGTRFGLAFGAPAVDDVGVGA